jgi:hypothetical protein
MREVVACFVIVMVVQHLLAVPVDVDGLFKGFLPADFAQFQRLAL